jgi:transcription-repair coupling factor (superfamily II helicase)
MQLTNILTFPIPAKPGDRLWFGNLPGSSLALVISNIAREQRGVVLVITNDMLSANRLEQALEFFAPEMPLLSFPDWETLPYDSFSPHQDIVSQRLLTLSRLPSLTQGILIVSITTLLQRVAPQQYIAGSSFNLNKGDKINLADMRRRLEHSGYRCVNQVIEHGEFAVRGSILDLFPTGSALPYRIDLFDDEVDTLRTFDPDTQRSHETVEKINLLPAREFPLTDAAITHFRQNWREQFAGNPAACPIYQDVSQGFAPAGVEYYLPLFFDNTEMLLDYLPGNSMIVRVENIEQQGERFWTEINERYEQNRHDITRPILTPNKIYLPLNDLFGALKQFNQIYLQTEPYAEGAGKINFNTQKLPDLTLNYKAEQPLNSLANYLQQAPDHRVLFCAESAGRREVLNDLLKNIHIQLAPINSWQEFLQGQQTIGITVAPLEQGVMLPDLKMIIIAEPELFGQQVMQKRRRRIKSFDSDAIVRNLAELNLGSPVVHLDHGVGRYVGLQTINVGDVLREFVTLEYANNDKLYVPVASLHLISRYSGVDMEHAPINRLGTDQWEKAKRKAAEQVSDVAAELLDVYARRAARKGHAFTKPDNNYAAFAAGFPFEETPDQQQAINEVLADMASEKPMDRLICGDVGFGKTEVAMRAAFMAVHDGRQVAILVPTTLLAQQHYQTFKDRFADWPVQIEVVSRFRTAQEQKNILEKVQLGAVDILIGTHKLIQKDVKFHNLGLLIIDEEHRFGVQQKEKLKALRSEVDILTMTATPIPRTLNMAMSGLRELSIIATPPARRLSIKTFVRERNTSLIREAIMRELLRGGQIYFLHNEVQTIEKIANEIAALVPEARVGIAHGQMHERELERVMADFYHNRFNVLVCTTIIETGIDVPSANTIIIDRADKFGLAQLHQLRGRVGRSHHQAYAYLMTPNKKSMTADALKRLDAISSLEDLGAGFTLATHDLEIRGAGELLGEEQSGNMQAIGFSLYMELLDRAVAALKSGKMPDLTKSFEQGAEIDLQMTALIPEDYLPDVHTRLMLYKRIASAADEEALRDLQVEMIDRFGLLPQPVKNLFAVTELKLTSKPLGIRKIEVSANGGRIEFTEKPNIDPTKIIKLIQTQSKIYKLDSKQRLHFTWPETPPEKRFEKINELLQMLKTGS